MDNKPMPLEADAEEWRPVPGYEGVYEVSNRGKVRSLDRIIEVYNNGIRYSCLRKGKLLRPGRTKSGHYTVSLKRRNSKYVHTLVAETFLGPCPDGMEVRHRDGNEAHNVLSNLAYGTRSQNNVDKKYHKGQSNYKLNPDDVKLLKAQLRAGKRGVDIAAEFGVAQSTVSAIKRGVFHADTP